jgi:RNA-directed DNA polymerase
MGVPESSGKPFDISKRDVWEAWLKVKENQGAPGVDGQSVADFEKDLKNNLYKVWNRMSSGSYLPPPVRAVEIAKPHGDGMRTLGIPTVADRIAQTVVAKHLEERVERIFHPDSYGYRPGRSAHEAVETARRRCWEYDWVIDLDIRSFFDTVPWEHVLAAIATHTDAAWVLLYVQRWLAAPLQHPDGTKVERDRGTPQGSPVSPVLANLFLHYALDLWLTREHPGVVFERYADDVLVHCATRAQAQVVLAGIEQRLRDLGMAVHPDKTKIVYCKDGKRRGRFPVVSFTFLGFMFCPRPSRNHRGEQFLAFLPAISPQALKKISKTVRRWRLHRRIFSTFDELARAINPIVAGWMQYYGRFYHSRLSPVLARINAYLVRWIRNKYRRLDRTRAAHRKLAELAANQPRLFRHWAWVTSAWR